LAFLKGDSIFLQSDFSAQLPGDTIKVVSHKVKRWVAALLAFPVIGITGAHRIYLGCAPYVPIFYLGTLGGFGILPTIDFFVIIFAKKEKFESYMNSSKVFMWAD
jgi:hypothetical protein